MTGEWTSYASMIVPRSQMGCIVMDDYLYVVGGTNRHNEVLPNVERYNFKEDRWQHIPPMLGTSPMSSLLTPMDPNCKQKKDWSSGRGTDRSYGTDRT